MIQWVKALTIKTEDLSLIPGIHMEEGKNPHTPFILELHMCTMAYVPPPPI